MKKAKRILALLAAIFLAGMYVCTFLLSFNSGPNAKGMLMASIACTVVLPGLLYVFGLVARLLDNRGSRPEEEAKENQTRNQTENQIKNQEEKR